MIFFKSILGAVRVSFKLKLLFISSFYLSFDSHIIILYLIGFLLYFILITFFCKLNENKEFVIEFSYKIFIIKKPIILKKEYRLSTKPPTSLNKSNN